MHSGVAWSVSVFDGHIREPCREHTVAVKQNISLHGSISIFDTLF